MSPIRARSEIRTACLYGLVKCRLSDARCRNLGFSCHREAEKVRYLNPVWEEAASNSGIGYGTPAFHEVFGYPY